MDGHEEIMMENGHCNDKGKLDGSMKAHCCRLFICFDTVTHGKSETCFDIEQCKSFTCNNTNNECWFCEREITMACFLML